MGILDMIAEGVDGGASTTLAAAIITGGVTLIVALIGVFATHIWGNRESESSREHRDDEQSEVEDLRKQRDAVQRKLSEADREIRRLVRVCIRHGVDPYENVHDSHHHGSGA